MHLVSCQLDKNLNYGTRQQYNLVVRATDTNGLYDVKITVHVQDLNDPPVCNRHYDFVGECNCWNKYSNFGV